jgi:hypothetical protein
MWYIASLFEYVSNPVSRFFAHDSIAARIGQSAVILCIAMLLLHVFDRSIQRATPKVAERADTITTTDNVIRLRRIETIVGLVITVIRVLVIIAAIFLIWRLSNPGATPIALIGVGTIVAVLASATIAPLLRDVTYGFIMIVERWYGVGDHIVVEPFSNTGGVVERVTLRSTKLRSVNGEAIWMHHQHMMGVRVTSAASHPLVVETFVRDPEKGRKVIEESIKIIPSSSTTVPQKLEISEIKQVSDTIWRITAICEIAPFREWIIDKFAIEVITNTDALMNKQPVIVHGPIVYYADTTAEKRYRRSAAVRKRVRTAANAASATSIQR